MSWFDTGMDKKKAEAQQQIERCKKLLGMDAAYQSLSIEDCDPQDFERALSAIIYHLGRTHRLTEPMKKFLDISEDRLWTRKNSPGLKACNHCLYQYYKKMAKRKGLEISVLESDFGMGGIEIYMHPPEIDVRKLIPDSHEYKKYHVAWFMELGDSCSC